MPALRGIAYTNTVEFGDQQIISGANLCDPANPMDFLDGLHTSVTGALGWESEEYLNGHVYLLNSPEGFSCLLRIWHKDNTDPHYPDCYAFQFLGNYESAPAGQVHHISSKGFSPFAPFYYRIWANACQIFIARVGVRQSSADLGAVAHKPYSVCGGVLYPLDDLAPTAPCAAATPGSVEATTELWWSAGDDGGNGAASRTVESFRSGHICRRYSFCHNGNVSSTDFATSESDALQLVIMRPGGYAGNSPRGWNDGFRFLLDTDPVQTEPFIASGGIIYGQLYDALLLSKPYALEQIEDIEETSVIEDELGGFTLSRYTKWINHTRNFPNQHPLGSLPDDGRLYGLMLFHANGPSPSMKSNYAY